MKGTGWLNGRQAFDSFQFAERERSKRKGARGAWYGLSNTLEPEREEISTVLQSETCGEGRDEGTRAAPVAPMGVLMLWQVSG